MRPFGAWFGRLAMAGACLAGAGCGGGDVPDPDSDRRAFNESAPPPRRAAAAPEAPAAPEPPALASNTNPAEPEKSSPAPATKPDPADKPAETEKPAPPLKGDASGTEEMLRIGGAPGGSTPPAGDTPSTPGVSGSTPGGSCSAPAPAAPGGSGGATMPRPGVQGGSGGGSGMPGSQPGKRRSRSGQALGLRGTGGSAMGAQQRECPVARAAPAAAGPSAPGMPPTAPGMPPTAPGGSGGRNSAGLAEEGPGFGGMPGLPGCPAGAVRGRWVPAVRTPPLLALPPSSIRTQR